MFEIGIANLHNTCKLIIGFRVLRDHKNEIFAKTMKVKYACTVLILRHTLRSSSIIDVYHFARNTAQSHFVIKIANYIKFSHLTPPFLLFFFHNLTQRFIK